MNNKVTCPNCGAEGTANTVCEYCGTRIPNSSKKQKKNKDSENSSKNIVKFQISKEEAVKAFLHKLSEMVNSPKDTFDKMEIKEVSPYFIPVYLYRCNFEAPWSCVKLVYESYKVGNETRRRTKRYPMNGLVYGKFKHVLPSCNKDSIPLELYEFINNEGVDLAYDELSGDYDMSRKDEGILIEPSGDSAYTILKNSDFNPDSGLKIFSAVRGQLPDRYEDLNYSCSSESTSIGRLILPFWYIRYDYEEKEYYFIVDGLGQKNTFSNPIDIEKKAEIHETKQIAEKAEMISSMYSLLWLGSFVVACLMIYGNINLATSMTDADNDPHFKWACIVYFTLIFFYYLMRKAAMKESKLQKQIRTELDSIWLYKKKSLLVFLSKNTSVLSKEAIENFSNEINAAIKERGIHRQGQSGALSKWMTIIVEIIGWLTLFIYYFSR